MSPILIPRQSRPVDFFFPNEEVYIIVTTICMIIYMRAAYGGDITCDFESPLWSKGHCNWDYAIESNRRLERTYAPPPDEGQTTRQRWGLGKFAGCVELLPYWLVLISQETITFICLGLEKFICDPE